MASYPRSGNTWLRFLIEKATGKSSGSIYQDRILTRTSEGIVIKTHQRDAFRYTHAIHLLRNPFDAIESQFAWKRDIAGIQDLTWEQHVAQAVQEWHAHTEYWLGADCGLLRVRYEDLREDRRANCDPSLRG